MPSPIAGLGEPYLQHALAAGVLVALLGACVGYFVIMRGATFATHALSQVGFAGAAGAVLVGARPIAGLIVFALLGAVGLSFTQTRRANDVLTALVLVTALGTGALFLALAPDYASNAFSLLFGTIVGVDTADLITTAVSTVAGIAFLGAIARPLLFASVARDAAAVAGLRVRPLDLAFYLVVALSAAVSVPIVGALLVFSLTIGPAAAAMRLSNVPRVTVLLAAGLGVAAVAGGVLLAYETDWPLGFFVAAITLVEYLAARATQAVRSRAQSTSIAP